MSEIKHKQEFVEGYIRSVRSQSFGKTFSTGITLESSGRPEIGSLAIQNLDPTNEIRLWYGLIPVDVSDLTQGYLPADPGDWTGPQTTNAESILTSYGEKIKAGEYLEQFKAPSNELYVYSGVNNLRVHIKEG